jgi:hypothetical protein
VTPPTARARALLETEANRLGVPELTAEDDRRLEELAAEMEQAAARGDLGATAAPTGPSTSWPSNGRAVPGWCAS